MERHDVPDLSFGFIKRPPLKHDGPVQPVRVITEGKILHLSLDLWPGPYGSIPEARVVADDFPESDERDACPVSMEFASGWLPCVLPAGHAGQHAYMPPLDFADE